LYKHHDLMLHKSGNLPENNTADARSQKVDGSRDCSAQVLLERRAIRAVFNAVESMFQVEVNI
jgi:hypothetical protein